MGAEPDLYRERYEPLALAGRGAQGEVWKARDHLHDRLVALKIRRTTSDERDTLLLEARTLLDMRPHEGLPLVRDDFFVDDRYVIVMDWIEGTNLAVSQPLAFEDVLGHVGAVADALDHLHDHDPPIVHRDVKPQNIVVTPQGRTVLVDFGLAGGAGTPYLAGTPEYLAPEVAAGGDATPAADVFSLAVTAYVLLTGSTPEPGLEADWPSVPEASRDQVRRVIANALAFDPAERPRSAAEFVASLRPPSAPNNLPAALSSFVGRGAMTSELRQLLASARIVTLTGTGGCGKTRLALHVADAALTSFAGGVWLAELAGITEAALVASRVSVALGARTDGGRDVLEALRDFLQTGAQLLVLDNCEHVIDECAHMVDALLRACPQLTILATSREPLRVTGEVVCNVAPLEQDEATELFADRAPHGVSLAPEDDAVVAEICRRLDGIPLAVELAAAQLGSIDVGDLSGALDVALGVLTGGVRTNPRQETMRATIDWSHKLLSASEQTGLRRLSVFAGGFTRDAAADVCEAAPNLKRLVETSLVAADDDRFRMLEPVRQFAADELAKSGERAKMRAEHARWFAEFAEQSSSDGSHQRWLERLTADHDNIEEALSYAVTEEPATAARIVRSAARYWARRGHWIPGRQWVDRTIAVSDTLDPRLRSELLKLAGDMARVQGALHEARARLEEAVGLDRQMADRHALAASLNSLGLVAHALGDLATTRSCYAESIALNREVENRIGLARALNNVALLHDSLGEAAEATAALEESLPILRELNALGVGVALINLASMHHKTGDLETARRYFLEAHDIFVENPDDYGRSYALNGLGALDLVEGDIATARERAVESLEIGRRLGDKSGASDSLHLLGDVARAENDLEQAKALHIEALGIRREIGAPLGVAGSMDKVGVVEVAQGDPTEAARRFGEAHAMLESAGTAKAVDPDVASAITIARTALGDDAFDRAWQTGQRNAAATDRAR